MKDGGEGTTYANSRSISKCMSENYDPSSESYVSTQSGIEDQDDLFVDSN